MFRPRTPGALVPAAILLTLVSVPARAAAIFTVTNTNDGGAGSFRQAILDANAAAGSDVIQFAIPGAGVHTILTFSPLNLTETVMIDGYSQLGSAWNTDPLGDNAVLLIELFGQGTDGLVVTGGSTIVQGLSLYGFQTAIALSGGFGSLIQGNFIGVSADGQANGNVVGVSIIGTYGPDRIGDNYPAARNLISANATGGLVSGGGQKKIFGNLIGTDASGAGAEPNGIGVRVIDSLNNQIGDGSTGGHNVISGNTVHGIFLTGGTGNTVAANSIGTDAATIGALGNGGDGVHVDGAVEGLMIYFNTISGNAGDGIEFAYATPDPAVPNVVNLNYIGSQFPNYFDLGNGGAGVRVQSGGALQIDENLIAFNHVGVWRIAPSVNDTVEIRRNAIYDHDRGLGIVLGPAEQIAPNAPLSPFNFPLITSAVTGGGNVTINGVYSGPASTEITLDFYANIPTCPVTRPQDFLEGFRYLGTHTLTTDVGGNATFSVSFMEPGFPDPVVAATATARVVLNASLGGTTETFQTSEFSQRLPFSISPASGAAAGGEPVTIHGTNFEPASAVTIGGVTPPNLVIADDTNITADSPAFPPGSANDIVVTNPDGTHGTLARGWIADFLDVPPGHPFHDYVLALVRNSIASGVGGGNYGVGAATLRQQMAVFLLKARYGACVVPFPCQGIFSDVPCPSTFADWIELLYDDGITGGCGPGIYCPTNPVLRQQMAVFLLKSKYGQSYVPPPCTGLFLDVPCPSTYADWIEQLSNENITGGCGGGNYCPFGSTTRGQMAVFIVKTFNLQ
jgi:IPT/TIG domain/S-layer homology domain